MSQAFLIEPLENRTLFAATTDIAPYLRTAPVVTAAQEVLIAEAGLADARDGYATTVDVDRQALAAATSEGKAAVQAARDALRQASGEQAGELRELLAQAEADFRANVASARQVLKEDTATGKLQVRDAAAQLKEAKREFKTALKQATAEQKQNVKSLVGTLTGILADPAVTAEQRAQLSANLAGAAKGATPPSQASIDQLATNLSAALDDGDLSKGDQNKLAVGVIGVLNSANLTGDQIIGLVDSARSIFSSASITPANIELVAGNLLAVYTSLNPDGS